MTVNRAKRVGEMIHREVAQMLHDGIKDPRIGFVTLTRVELTDDLRHGKIFVSVYGSEEEKKKTMEALESATGYVRREIGQRVRLRYTPSLCFKFDNSIEYAAHIDEVLKKIKDE